MGSSFFSAKNDASQFIFSEEEIRKLIFDSAKDQQVLRRGTWLEIDCNQQDALQAVMDFMQKFLMRRMPSDSDLTAVRDTNTSQIHWEAPKRKGGKVAMLTVEMACLFAHQGSSSSKVVSAGDVYIDYRMVEGENPVFSLERIRTDSPAVAAFFQNDPQQVERVVHALETNLEYQESASHSRNLNRGF